MTQYARGRDATTSKAEVTTAEKIVFRLYLANLRKEIAGCGPFAKERGISCFPVDGGKKKQAYGAIDKRVQTWCARGPQRDQLSRLGKPLSETLADQLSLPYY